jgi:hypothetical protein
MHQGYIKLPREILDDKAYFSEPFTRNQAWIDLLLLANYKDNTRFVRGIPIEVRRGQVAAGEDFLAARWQWSRGKVRRYFAYLEGKSVQKIVQHKSKVINIITIVNYDKYQSGGTTDDTTDRQQADELERIVEKDKNVKKDIVPGFIKKETWTAFLEMRRKIGKPATDTAREIILKRLAQFEAEGHDPNAILNQSIVCSWTNVFPLKNNNGSKRGQGNNDPDYYTRGKYGHVVRQH